MYVMVAMRVFSDSLMQWSPPDLSVSAVGVQAGCFLFSIGSFFLVLEFVIPGHSGLVPAWTMVALTLTLYAFTCRSDIHMLI
jgi:hypothetical protein